MSIGDKVLVGCADGDVAVGASATGPGPVIECDGSDPCKLDCACGYVCCCWVLRTGWFLSSVGMTIAGGCRAGAAGRCGC